MGVEPQFIKPQDACEFPQGGRDAATGDAGGFGSCRISGRFCVVSADGSDGWCMVYADAKEASCSRGNGVTVGKIVGLHCDRFPAHTILLCVEEEGDGVCVEESEGWCRGREGTEFVPELHILEAELDGAAMGSCFRVLA